MTQFEPPGGPPQVKLVLAYDGTGFHGFAAQRDVRTVEGELAAALERVLRHKVELSVAGRTDTGVHAWGQVVSFPADFGIEPDRVQFRLNGILAPEVVVRSASLAPHDFHARYSTRSRTYRYTIVNRPVADPFRARYAWWVDVPLDLRALRLASDPFVGAHDFAAFCRRGPAGTTTMRRVFRSEWSDLGDGLLRYEVTANAFCWQMVRALVGTIVDAGLGRRRPGEMLSILRGRDRAVTGTVAPAHGLTLWSVDTGPEDDV
jgi:tRNA pseudouridine38-40 synthase